MNIYRRFQNRWPTLAILAAIGVAATIFVGQDKSITAAPPSNAPSANTPSPNVKAPSAAPSGSPAVAVSPTDGKRYALLVGCTKYHNKAFDDLEGPANDIPLVQQLLVKKFEFPIDNIVELTEAAAALHGPNFRPTRANIKREFENLRDKAKAGDYVMILMSGHGSQEPETDQHDLRYAKSDGYDSIFLPEDIGQWNGRDRMVDNAIVDYQLRAWTKRITQTGASLWIVVDACCSGTILRAATNGEVARKVEPTKLGIPEKELKKADQKASEGASQQVVRRGLIDISSDDPSSLDLNEHPSFELDDHQSPNFVGLYASMPREPTVELPMPPGPQRGAAPKKKYGLLTYTMCELLEKSANHFSYFDLHRLIGNSYQQMGYYTGPSPWIEGLAQGRAVLGVEVPEPRPWMLLQRKDKSWTVNAGNLQGLTDGSILAVYPPAYKLAANKPLGYVKISSSSLLESDVDAWDYDKQAPAANDDFLKPRLPCKSAFIDFGSMRLSIAVDIAHANSAPIQDQLQKIKTALSEHPQSPRLFDVVEELNGAQWVLQQRGGKIVLLDGHSAQISEKSPLPIGTPAFDISTDGKTDPTTQVSTLLRQIFRGQNLLLLTKPTIQVDHQPRKLDELATDASDIDVEVRMLKFNTAEDETGTPLTTTGGNLVVTPGMRIGWEVVNHSRFDVDVTLLFVDTEFNIQAVFPNRPGGDFDNLFSSLGHSIVAKSTATDKPLGAERMVVIAVPHEGLANNFAFLALSTAEEAKSRSRGSGGEDPAFNSPLGQFCRYATYGVGTTRSMSFSGVAEKYKTDLLQWSVLPAVATKGAKQ